MRSQKGSVYHFWMGEEFRMKRCKLQSVDIFRIDSMIWGAVGRVFKIQTGLCNVRKTEALSGSKIIPLFLLLNKPSFLFALYPFLSCFARGFLIHIYIWVRYMNVSILHARFPFLSLWTQKEYSNGGNLTHPSVEHGSLFSLSKTRGSGAHDYKHALALDSSGSHLASTLVILWR